MNAADRRARQKSYWAACAAAETVIWAALGDAAAASWEAAHTAAPDHPDLAAHAAAAAWAQVAAALVDPAGGAR